MIAEKRKLFFPFLAKESYKSSVRKDFLKNMSFAAGPNNGIVLCITELSRKQIWEIPAHTAATQQRCTQVVPRT